jgi:hypothetical protein
LTNYRQFTNKVNLNLLWSLQQVNEPRKLATFFDNCCRPYRHIKINAILSDLEEEIRLLKQAKYTAILENVATLTIKTYTDLNFLMELLHLMPNIEELIVDVHSVYCFSVITKWPVLAKLRKLKLCKNSSMEMRDFICNSAGNLIDIQLNLGETTEKNFFVHIVDKHQESLRQMNLTFSSYSQFVEIFCSVKKLESLKLYIDSYDWLEQKPLGEGQAEKLFNIFKNMAHLKNLELDFCASSTFIEIITNCCPEIETLRVTMDAKDVARLKRLKHLAVSTSHLKPICSRKFNPLLFVAS